MLGYERKLIRHHNNGRVRGPGSQTISGRVVTLATPEEEGKELEEIELRPRGRRAGAREERTAGQARPRMYFPLSFVYVFFNFFSRETTPQN